MDTEPKKKRKRGPYLKNRLEIEDESELTLFEDSSYANLQAESETEQQTTSTNPKEESENSNTGDNSHASHSIAQCSGKVNEEDNEEDDNNRTASVPQFQGTPAGNESVDEEVPTIFPLIPHAEHNLEYSEDDKTHNDQEYMGMMGAGTTNIDDFSSFQDISIHQNIYEVAYEKNTDENLTLEALMDDPFVSKITEIGNEDDDLFCNLIEDDYDQLTFQPEQTNDDIDNDPLYSGSNITIGAFMLLIAIFAMKYNLIGDGVEQMLKIIALTLPNGHRLCTTLHAFKRYFRNLQNPLIKHYYCARCLAYNQHLENCTVCGNPMNKTNRRYFLEMPIENQLKNLFLQNGFYDNLQSRFQRTFSNKYEDITDGLIYRKLFENDGPLSSQNNISFVLNTDGAPVFKSSKVSIWPIFLVINELPYKLRMKKENMIMAALWFGNEKPSMGTFLKPIQKSFQALNNGIHCYSPEHGDFICKSFLIAATADLPARSMLCNSIQYNGKFGCWKCLQPGETASVGKGHTHVFPFQKEDPAGPARSSQSVEQDSIQVVRNLRNKMKNYAVNGVKGPSWISYFPYFDCVKGIAIDYMHGVLLGVQKLLLTLWFSPKHKDANFSMFHFTDKLNSRLEKIQPTLDITRLPRSITEMKYWKASEYRSFLLYYGAPVLYGLLNDVRFNHIMSLVNAMHILLGHSSTVNDVDKAERMLISFCEHFEDLYSRCFMTLNIHQLVHLAEGVRCLGPLYTHSCFPFEDKNGFVLKLIRGTQNIDNQIIHGVSFIQKIPELKQKCLESGSKIEKLCHAIENPHSIERGEKINDSTYILGAVKKRTLQDDEYDALCQFTCSAIVCNDDIFSFTRLEKDKSLIYGLEYGRMTKRDNSTIMFCVNYAPKFGRVRCFLKLWETNIPVAIVEELICTLYNDESNLLSVQKSNSLAIVPVDKIKMSLMLIQTEEQDRMFVCKFPNKLECD